MTNCRRQHETVHELACGPSTLSLYLSKLKSVQSQTVCLVIEELLLVFAACPASVHPNIFAQAHLNETVIM